MKQKLLNSFKLRVCLLVAILCASFTGTAWAAENDTHDFSQSLSQLLNNNASIASINIAAQSYTVKKVIVSYRYNKEIENAVTVGVTVKGVDWGSQYVVGTGSNYTTMEFTGGAVTGAIELSFTNNTGGGTGHGTFYVNNVQLVEGPAATPATVTFSDGGSLTEASAGAGVTLPTREAAGDVYTFAGWSITNVNEETTTAPTIIPAGTYQPTADVTLYPIYRRTEGSTSTNGQAAVTIGNLGLTNNTQYSSLDLNNYVTATASSGTNTGKYYSSNGSWRFYANESATLTIEVDNGTISSIIISYTGNTLKYNTSDITSGESFTVNNASAVISVSGSSSNSQITAITVNYTITSVGTTYYTSNPVTVAVTGISLNKSETTIAHGGTETLVVTVAPNDATNKNVTWSSSNTDVATVANGVVTAVAPGTATITATSVADNTKTATCAVTVTAVAVTGVSLNKTATTIEKDKTETLVATIAPTNATNKNVTWESDNTSVATVSNIGVVTGAAVGTATITVTTADGSFTATCTVTVNAAKGSVDNPYTVAEVRNGDAAGKNNIYVKGFIVGSWNNSSFNVNDLVDSNLALADTYNGTSTIPVELSSNSGLRTSWGPLSNSDLIGVAQVVLKGNGENYFSQKGIKGTSEITKVAEAVTVTSVGYATYCSESALDFTNSSIKAYVGTVSNQVLTFRTINQVPANTGVLLYKDGGATEAIPVIASATAVSNNCLTGVNAQTTISSEDYILSSSTDGVGFYKAGQYTTLGAHKAYIPASYGNEVKSFAINFDEVDAIGAIKAVNGNADIFNLAGQRVNKAQKGIYIINGKKVLVK